MNDRYCLITGAAGGFGRAYTKTCSNEGFIPILTDIDHIKLEEIKQDISKTYGLTCITIPSDIRRDDGTNAVWQYLDEHHIKLSRVINTVGIEIEGMFADLSSEHILNIVKTNVVGFTNILSHSLKYKSNQMEIINFGSLAGFFSMPYKAVYAASKSYIINLSRALHLELKPQNVNLLVVCPAGVPTRQEVIDRIKKQGFYGKVTTSKVDDIVSKSLKLVKKGKAVYVPRLSNKLLIFIARLLPSLKVTKIISRRWMKKDK